MDRQLVYRALGVPDAITIDTNREQAARFRLAMAAGYSREALSIGRDDLGVRLGAVLDYVVERAESGRLDGLVGGYETAEWTAETLVREIPGFGVSDADS